jgi:hypothetical protein
MVLAMTSQVTASVTVAIVYVLQTIAGRGCHISRAKID